MVRGRVTVRRAIAATDVAASEVDAEVQPLRLHAGSPRSLRRMELA
jgi:hypothetical protein